MFWTKCVEKIKRHFTFSLIFFFRKSCRLCDKVEKYCRAGQATDGYMAHAHCVLGIQGYKYTLEICDTYCFSTAVAQTRLNVTLYVHCLPCLELRCCSTSAYKS